MNDRPIAMPPAPVTWPRGRHYAGFLRETAAGGGIASELYARSKEACIRNGSTFDGKSERNVFMQMLRDMVAYSPERRIMEMDEARMALLVMEFQQHGSQIFEIDAALADELAATDVDDVFIEDVRLPYETFYLTFPPTTIEGAQGVMVSREGHVLHMALTTSDEHGAREVERFMFVTDPQYGTIGGSMAAADEAYDAIADRNDPSTDPERALRGQAMLRRLAPLVFNALLFIDNCHVPQDRRWPRGAPNDLTTRAEGRVGARKAEQALVRLGWTRTRLCSMGAATDAEASPHDAARRATIARHWRRGHWRRLTAGGGVRLVRVRPTLVGAGAAAEGRTYVRGD